MFTHKCHPQGTFTSLNSKNRNGPGPEYKSHINSNMEHVTLQLLTDVYPEFAGSTCKNLPLREIKTDSYHSRFHNHKDPDFFLEKKKTLSEPYSDYYQGGRNMLHQRYGYERKMMLPKKWKIAHGQVNQRGVRNRRNMQLSDTELLQRSFNTNYSEQKAFVDDFGSDNSYLIHNI